MKQLTKKLDKFGDKTWRSRCAEDIGCSYQTVLNATNGTYTNFKVRKWISDEIEKMNQLFI